VGLVHVLVHFVGPETDDFLSNLLVTSVDFIGSWYPLGFDFLLEGSSGWSGLVKEVLDFSFNFLLVSFSSVINSFPSVGNFSIV